jgi:SNF2 family DNA or RNA helicase
MRFLTQLLPHQAAAFTKLSKLKVGALYMEQGTGKTRTTLELVKARLDKKKVEVVLWLCPCSVKRNLKEDIGYHCGVMPDEIIIRGIESLSSSDRLYLMLTRLVTEYKVFLVVDESNLVKNKAAIRTSRIIELAKHCSYKMILNGTPVSKSEADMFAQWYILDWRILGYESYYSFAANHIEYWTIKLPDGREIVDRDRVKNVLNISYLTEKIAPYTYQIKKSECLKLPEKRYRSRAFYMTDEQKKLYDRVKFDYLENVDEFKSETIYKLFTALQHVTSGRIVTTGPKERMLVENIFEDPAENPRIKELLYLIKDIDGEKAIIFAKYQSELDEIAEMLNRQGKTYTMFTGKVNQTQRQANRELFRGPVQFLLANKTCGAYGLNLQFCHNVIYYSNDFDLATRMQSEDRVHRIGQTNPVNIYDIYSPGCIDEFISDCLSRKEDMVARFKAEISKLKEVKTWESYTPIKTFTKQHRNG